MRPLPCDDWADGWRLEECFPTQELPPMQPGLGGGHPKEALEQLAAIGLIKASRRYDCKRVNRSSSNFIAYARPFVNGEITH
ncbi:MAG: hypothetical protein VKK63_10025, partial [Synechococcus sp.]|nr:hypothetical protein [Synechococcus sp.]